MTSKKKVRFSRFELEIKLSHDYQDFYFTIWTVARRAGGRPFFLLASPLLMISVVHLFLFSNVFLIPERRCLHLWHISSITWTAEYFGSVRGRVLLSAKTSQILDASETRF